MCEHCFVKGKSHPHPGKECRQKTSRALPANASKKYFSTRTVVNSKKCFVQSRDWKQDWWFCNNVSYADVVKNKCKSVSRVQVQSIDGYDVQGVEKHRNTRTKGECIADKNIEGYCSKNITPTCGHNA